VNHRYIEFKAGIARHIHRSVHKDVDGYYKWFPSTQGGGLDQGELEMIAKLLREANRLWDEQLRDYFSQES
jgi:hypothetical protein